MLFADKKSEHQLSLQFSNLMEDEADLIVKHWNEQLGNRS